MNPLNDRHFNIDSRYAEFVERTLLYLDGNATELDVAKMNEEMKRDPGKRRVFIELCRDAQLIRETPEVELDDKIVSVWFGRDARGRYPWQRPQVLAAAAIIGLLASTLITLLIQQQNARLAQPAELPPATLIDLVDAQWEHPQKFEVGKPITAGRLRLTSGFARIRMNKGAIVTLEGPTEFRIVSEQETYLNHGRLSATVPFAAKGFRVNTDAMDVVDLGTAFGVESHPEQGTTVAVFSGKVAVGKAEMPSWKPLLKGQAVKRSSNGAKIQTVKFDPRAFQGSWALNTGIRQLNGKIRLIPPGAPSDPFTYGDNRFITLVPERESIRLTDDLEVDFSASGRYRSYSDRVTGYIQAGERVRSYLLQLNPDPYQEQEENLRLHGTVTFNQPIVGVIVSSARLLAVDDFLGNEIAGAYRVKAESPERGLEEADLSGEIADGADVVELSEDRFTLRVRFKTRNGLDHVRVIVRAEMLR